MNQIVCLHLGQAGINAGNSLWELFCLEHGLRTDGAIADHQDRNENRSTLFSQRSEGYFTPRTVFIDLEPTTIDETRTGKLHGLFHPDSLLSAKGGTGSNYARGYYTQGRQILDRAMNQIRIEVDKCQNFKGFLLFNSLGGGTGSGLGSLLAEKINEVYGKKMNMGYSIHPEPSTCSPCLQPYNLVLSTHSLMEYQDVSIVMDNEALQQICRRNLDIQEPSFPSYNRIIAQVVAAQTCSLRLGGALNENLNQFSQNLVLFPRLHFLTSSFSPILSLERSYHSLMGQQDIANSLFEPANQMARCDLRHGKFTAITIMYRGDHIPKDVSRAIYNIKVSRTVQFADCSNTGFKVGINYEPPVVFPDGDLAPMRRSACMISNSTSIASVLARSCWQFDLMHNQRAFLHCFTREGMEEDQFQEARQDLRRLQQEYDQI